MKLLLSIILLLSTSNVYADFNTGDTFGKGLLIQANGVNQTGGGRTLNFASGTTVTVANNAYQITASGGGSGSGNVGIGTINSIAYYVGTNTVGASNNLVYVNGNTGIGTSTPDWPLTTTNTHLLNNSNLVIGISTVIPFDAGTGIQGFGFSATGSHGSSDTVGLEGASYQNTDNSGFEGTILYDDTGSFAGGLVYGNLTNPFLSGYSGLIYKNDLSILTPSGGSQTTFDSMGNVGIGSFVPIGNLDVESNPTGNATICLNGSCVTSLSGGGGTNLWQLSPGNIGINTTQQVSIGTINPVDKLTVVTSMATTSSGITVQNRDSTGETGITLKDDTGANQGTISYSNNSTANVPPATLVLGNNSGFDYINQNGSIGIGTTTPQAAIHAWFGGSGSHLRFDITDINLIGTESYDLTSGIDSRVATLEHDNSSSSDPYPDATVLASFSGPLNLTTSYGIPNSGIIVAANGNVGVGTSLPNTSFQVFGTTDVTQNIFSGPMTTMPFDGTYSYAFHGFGINNVSPNSLDGSAFQNQDASGGEGVGLYDNNNNISLALLHGNSASTLSGLPANSNVLRFTKPFTIASFDGSGVGQYFGVDSNVSFLAGNVGIGTNSPQSTLSIFGSTSSALHPPSVNLQNGNSAGFSAVTFSDESGTLSGDMALTNTSYSALPKTLFIGAFNNDNLMLSSNGASSPAIYIPANTSNVGIGTTIPADWLQINNNGGQNGITLLSSNSTNISFVDSSNTQRGSLGMSFTGGGQAQFQTNNGQTIRITTNGAGGGSDPSGITLISGGNVGIATLTPAGMLSIASSAINKVALNDLFSISNNLSTPNMANNGWQSTQNGTSSISTTSTGAFGITTAFTTSEWVKFLDNPGTQTSLIMKESGSGGSNRFFFSNHKSDNHINFVVNDAAASTQCVVTSSGTLTNDGSFHHIVGTYSTATGCVLYIDGSNAGSDSTDKPTLTPNNGFPWRFMLNDAATQPTYGVVDEINIFPRALSSSEVTTLYASGLGIYGNTANAPFNSGISIIYHLDNSSGTTITDSSGNSFGGTLNNQASPSWVTGKIINPTVPSPLPKTILTSKNGVAIGEGGIITLGDGTGQINLNYGTSASIQLNGVNTLTSSSSGNIGIGTLTPNNTLDINGSFRLEGNGAASNNVLTSSSTGVGTWTAPSGSGGIVMVSYQPGLLSAINGTVGVNYKFSKTSTVDNIIGSAVTFSCISNPTVTMYECGTSTTCSGPTTIGTVTVTAAGTATAGSISSATITAGDYIGWAMTAGTCASIDIAVTAQVHTN